MKITTLRCKALMALVVLLIVSPAFGQLIEFSYPDAWGNNGFNLTRQDQSGVRVIHSIPQLALYDFDVDGAPMKMIDMEGIFLSNDEGAPNLPGNGRYIAIPQGATASLRVNAVRKEIIENIEFMPAPNIPLADDDDPVRYIRDMNIYGIDAYYPAEPFVVSEPTSIRGVDVVMLGITPFQYNPVSRQLIIYHDVDVEVVFEGGNGIIGDSRLRSRWWDPIIEDAILNREMIPAIDYSARFNALMSNRSDGYEYIVVVPDHPDFIAWADSIRVFRNNQGIRTQVVTTAQIGANNHVQIKNYIANAYNNWDIAPAAVLFLADYGTTGNTITSEYRTDHPYGSSSAYISDTYYGDMNGNHMPDIITARITAQHSNDLQNMVPKFLNYERTPPTNPNFYNEPITAMGWQTERWFQLCTESVAGYWEIVQNKQPLRQNNIYSGSPGSSWSSNANTSMVLNVFGPNGLGYIPATPSHLHGYGWTANATSLNNAINSGAFMVLHRDHGLETGWGEPHYRVQHLSGLNNQDLTFVFTINCLTGKFNWSGVSFAEAFHRHQYGALGLIAPTEISYSFVNDTYVWGMFNNMWPDFMPMYGANPESRGVMPSFANAAGKYFLQQSNWPSNPQHKQITYYLFHHHGDAFTTVYSEVPQQLTVNHMPVLLSGLDEFEVTADAGSLIGLSVNNELIGVAEGTGMPVSIPIISQLPGNELVVTITKQNYYRYEAVLEIIPPDGPYVILNESVINDVLGNNNSLIDYGETIQLGVALKNVGLENAVNVNAVLSTASQYVIITNNTHLYQVILPDEIYLAENAFTFEVSDDIPDGYMIEFLIYMTSGNHEWSNTFFLKAHAPEFSVGNLVISDPLGNNDGVLDPGETVDLLISTTNIGHSKAFDLEAMITCSNEFITINISEFTYAGLEAGESTQAVFTITADEDAPIGTPIAIHYTLNAGAYTAAKSFTIQIGMIVEDFEAGDFSKFPWTFAGNQPWTITNTGAFQGDYAAKSGTIGHSQSSQMIMEYDVAVDDSISFFRRVSSENNDYLRFFINNQQVGQWSGVQPWARVTYPVSAGIKTFKWEYVKNASVTGGEDCAWIDYIVFPIQAACPAPRNLNASAITAHTAQINWVAGGEELQWDIIYGLAGFNPETDGTLIEDISSIPYELSGIQAVTEYQVYVRSICTEEFISAWNGPISFTTLCATFELPFNEPFSGASVSCWSFPQGQGNWNFGTSYTPPSSTSGAPNAFFNWSPSMTNYSHSLTSPLVDGTNISEVKINYILFINSYSSNTVENMSVEFKALEATEWTLLELFTTQGLGSGNAEHIRTDQVLEGMAGTFFQVRFRAHGANSFNINGWGLDDVIVHGEQLAIIPGDANCDGTVDILDAITIINYIMGNNPEPFCFENADVTSDGIINVLDIIGTVNIVLGGTKSSPFEITSETAHIYLNKRGIDLLSDGTLAGLQFEIDGIDASQLNFILKGYELISTMKDGKLMGLIISFDNTPIPAGRINLFEFNTDMSDLKWGEVVAGNLNAENVKVVKHQLSDFALSAYPNPSKGQFIVEVGIPQTSETVIRLVDMMGREVSNVHRGILSAGVYRYDLDMNLRSGIYFLQVQAVSEDAEVITKHLKVVVTE